MSKGGWTTREVPTIAALPVAAATLPARTLIDLLWVTLCHRRARRTGRCGIWSASLSTFPAWLTMLARVSMDDDRVEGLLSRLREGDATAGEELFDILYPELRGLARSVFRSQPKQHTLQPTAVVHEAYLKVAQAASRGQGWQDRAHFFAVAARAMRQVLVNHARDKAAQKRGGDVQQVTLTDAEDDGWSGLVDALAVHQALEKLAELDERQAKVAELRFFAGLANKEIAEVLGVSLRTVELDWKVAKSWLVRELGV
ncbi:MAG: sigma-70 family RNA polymerase sigma factor [Acidobacteriota bacterium]